MLLNYLLFMAKNLLSTATSKVPVLMLAYIGVFVVQVFLNYFTLSKTCFSASGIHSLIPKLKTNDKISRRVKIFSHWLICFVILFMFSYTTVSVMVTYTNDRNFDFQRNHYYWYVSDKWLFYVSVVHDNIMYFFSNSTCIGLPLLQMCVAFCFILEFEQIYKNLQAKCTDSSADSFESELLLFISKYMTLGKLIKEFDNIFSNMLGFGIGAQIPILCLIFYHLLLSPCPEKSYSIVMVSTLTFMASVTVLPALLDSKVSEQTLR